jgi:protein TonB
LYEKDGTTTQHLTESGQHLGDSNVFDESKAKPKMSPQFPGGEKMLYAYLAKNIRYPVKAMEKGISGKVIVKFLVRIDGLIGDIQIVKSLGEDIDAEAMRVVMLLPKFTPGSENGNRVPMWYTLPIQFNLTSTIRNNNF